MKETVQENDNVLQSPVLGLAAKVVERMVNQNTYDDIAIDFKYWDDASDQFKAHEGTLLPLWKFTNERARKKSVTSVCWSPAVRYLALPELHCLMRRCIASLRTTETTCTWTADSRSSACNPSRTAFDRLCMALLADVRCTPGRQACATSAPRTPLLLQPATQKTCTHHRSRASIAMQYEDMFAIGYGSYDFLKPTSGLICIFSLANPTYPEYSFYTDAGVLSVDFHPQYANLLAVGLYDGTVMVFDVARKQKQLIYKSTVESGTHSEPVWQVRARARLLVSVTCSRHVQSLTLRSCLCACRPPGVCDQLARLASRFCLMW